ncbi:MAG TPA: glycosyltransferase family 2 protein, partial [Geobacteraceae bacterium]|nr:glycosyltransferase family 2 protein [Geobacteraceae bacterium]
MHNQPKVTAVIPIFNSKNETLAFLESMANVTYANLSITVVDDGSTDGSAQAIAERFPGVKIITGDGNLWWSGATNLGVKDAQEHATDFILTINNDDVVDPGFIEPLVETAVKNPRSLVNSIARDYDERSFISSFGGEIEWFVGEIRDRTSRRDTYDPDCLREGDFLTGNSTLVPAGAYQEIGFYDHVNCPQYIGDAEFSLRARKRGYRLLLEPRSVVYNRTAISGGISVLNRYGIAELVTSIRSPFYFKANCKIYRNYCPYHPFWLFLAIRYVRLIYS